MKRYLGLVVLLFLTIHLGGQTCCSGGVPVSSNLGFRSESEGTLQLSIQTDFNVLTTLYSGSIRLDDDFRKRTTQSYLFRASYGIDSRLAVEVFFPWVRQTRKIYTPSGSTDFESSHGVGDPVALLIYNVVNNPIHWRIGAGSQMPLGRYDVVNDKGLFLTEDLQPGSGSWDWVFFSSLEVVPSRSKALLLSLNTIFSRNGVNDRSRNGAQSYRFGDEIQLIANLSDQWLIFNQVVTSGIGLRYRNAARDRIDEIPNSGTGGHFLFARFTGGIPLPRELGEMGIQFEIPLYTRVNETQLAPSYRLNFGWFKKFGLKNDHPISEEL